jgi:hypothetical protein
VDYAKKDANSPQQAAKAHSKFVTKQTLIIKELTNKSKYNN